tara:strand:- start:7829 stop:9088 length:1260 start_codon:yes stop_codon:yes gene_type:complete
MNSDSTLPFMLSDKDEELLGVANRTDGMGVLAVWSVRGRDLVPHLTEQTTSVRGFQILVEAFRLWELYEPDHPQHAGRLDDFFLLIEQAFARIVAWHNDGKWPLPGSRRVLARAWEEPQISLKDPTWHLLGGQKANGLWGLYRGASRRAGLLSDDMLRLSDGTRADATTCTVIGARAQKRLFKAVASAMDGASTVLPTNSANSLVEYLWDTFWDVPLANHLQARFIDGHDLNKQLAQRLLVDAQSGIDEIDHRVFLKKAAEKIPEHESTISDALRCENLLAVVETVFLSLCAGKGKQLETVADELLVDLGAIGEARTAFGHSGFYKGETALARQTRFYEQLETSSPIAFARSVLMLHEKVSKERKRAPWVWEEDDGVLRSDVDVDEPSKSQLQVGVGWRNDYYLYPLKQIASQLAELVS